MGSMYLYAVKTRIFSSSRTISEFCNNFLNFLDTQLFRHVRAEWAGNCRRCLRCLAKHHFAGLPAGVVYLRDQNSIMLVDPFRKFFEAGDLLIVPQSGQVFEPFSARPDGKIFRNYHSEAALGFCFVICRKHFGTCSVFVAIVRYHWSYRQAVLHGFPLDGDRTEYIFQHFFIPPVVLLS
ncbi:MAG: hypothetical protein AGIKBDMD_01803 [Synergistaceae bacterium]